MIFVTAIFEGADSSAPFSFQENSTKSKSGQVAAFPKVVFAFWELTV